MLQLKFLSTQTCVLLIVAKVGFLSLTIQNDVSAAFDTKINLLKVESLILPALNLCTYEQDL